MAVPTALQQQALANDPNFRARVKFNLENVIGQVLNESTGVAGHSTRANYARTIFASIDANVGLFAGWLVTRGNLLAANTSVSI